MKNTNVKDKKKIKKRKIDKSKKKPWQISEFNIVEVLSIVVVSIIFGVVVGCLITYKRDFVSGKEISKELQEFISVYDNIKENYYGDLDEKKLMDSAISGMVSSLDDPYTLYMNSDETTDFNQSVNGSFVGIGASVYVDNNEIVEIYDDSSAKEAGLKVHDVIIGVDDRDVREIHGDDLTSLIKGKENTFVKIKVLRDNKELTFNVKRKIIELKSVTSEFFIEEKQNIGLLTISSFASNTYKQFKKELDKLERKKIDSLIIDVRDNPGGHLTQVANILDIFFDKKTVLYQIETNKKKEKVFAKDSNDRSLPVVILANSGSASASEILISCFKDNYKDVTFVGQTTYGKGMVQKTLKLSSGSSIKYTSQKWLTSKGKWINEKGLKPDYEVNLSSEYYDNPTYSNDAQLQKAIEILKEK